LPKRGIYSSMVYFRTKET